MSPTHTNALKGQHYANKNSQSWRNASDQEEMYKRLVLLAPNHEKTPSFCDYWRTSFLDNDSYARALMPTRNSLVNLSAHQPTRLLRLVSLGALRALNRCFPHAHRQVTYQIFDQLLHVSQFKNHLSSTADLLTMLAALVSLMHTLFKRVWPVICNSASSLRHSLCQMQSSFPPRIM